MVYKLPDIRTTEVSGKRVFLRADTDVPLSELRTTNSEPRTIEDETRLKAWLPTLEFLLEQGATVIIGGKLGRPEGIDPKLSLWPVGRWLVNRFNDLNHLSNMSLDGFSGWKILDNLFLLENLQFYKEEKANDESFAEKLATLSDVYVNDAFAVCHRSHASIAGIPRLLPHFAGLRLQKEVEVLGSILENPKRPLVVIIGGKKVETKLPLVSKMGSFADRVLVGGLIAKEIKEVHPNLTVATLNDAGNDLSNKSIQKFVETIKTAKTIVWNGPVGKISNLKSLPRRQAGQISNQDLEWGTRKIAQAIVESSAYKVVGGGDTVEFLKRIGLLDKFDFVSTGGGAMLAFLTGEKLPGLEALVG